MSADVLEFVLGSELIAYVEEDQLMQASEAAEVVASAARSLDAALDAEQCNFERTTLWNLERINSHDPDEQTGRYLFPQQGGANVDAYIIDTGILVTHEDFGGRAVWAANYVDKKDTDCNGHGTHVAGTVGGTRYGVSKQVTLHAVKVLGCRGSGSNLGVIKGVEYVAQAAQNSSKRCVANMSLGGGISDALDDAVNAVVAAGCFFGVAAGNDNADACNNSPARARSATTVGATALADKGDQNVDVRSVFSNYGECVQVFAPGTQITSDWIGSNTATNTISGTSMATPNVVGAAALYFSVFPDASIPEAQASLVDNATEDSISMDCGLTKIRCNQSPNKLLYTTSCA